MKPGMKSFEDTMRMGVTNSRHMARLRKVTEVSRKPHWYLSFADENLTLLPFTEDLRRWGLK
jgi:hypothetical protein